jgi:uncharacterized membrane protein YdbT with pleckstrin-like domain
MPNNRDLIPGETELLHVNRHVLVMVKRVLLPTVVVLAIVIAGALVRPTGQLGDLRWFVLLALLLGLFVYLDVQYIIWRSETYTITDERVLLRRGVIGKFSRSIGLARVQDVSTSQNVLGRIFDFGTVEIESAGKDGAEVLTYVPDPQHFRNVLFERLHGSSAPTGASL